MAELYAPACANCEKFMTLPAMGGAVIPFSESKSIENFLLRDAKCPACLTPIIWMGVALSTVRARP